MLNFLGVTENFAVIENIPYSMTWAFSDSWTGEPISLDGVTFTGKILVGENRREIEMDIAKGEQAHILVLGCVGLPEGRWPYEVICISDDGLKERMLSGYIGVIGSLQIQPVLDGIPLADRTLSVRLPGDTARRLKLEWLSTSIAQTAAQSAWDAWKKTQATADKLAQADGKLDDLTQKADHAMQELGKVDGLMSDLHEEVDRAHEAVQKAEDLLNSGILTGEKGDTPYIGSNAHWWIADTDTGVTAEGKDGLTPHIGANGHWWIGETDTQIQAEGSDGLDADSIRRIYIDSVDQLPEEGSKGIYYYIPGQDGTYEVYAWVEFPDGEAAWTPINESILKPATVATHGTVRLSTGSTLTEGGIIGTNESGQLLARIASSSAPGVIKLATSAILSDHYGYLGLNAKGQAGVVEAAWNRPGVIKIINGKNTERGALVQTNAEAQAIVPLAGNRSYGVVATGTDFPVTPHERPYIVSLPIASDDSRLNPAALHGTLTINLHRKGFLRYTAGANEENGLDFSTGRYLSFDYGTGLVSEEYTSTVEGITDTRFRIAVKRYGDIVFQDSYATPSQGGSVRIGGTLIIDEHGILNARAASASTAGVVKIGLTLAIDEHGLLNIQKDEHFDEASLHPATSAAIAEWIKNKKYISESTLQGKQLVSETRLEDILAQYQKKMEIADIIPMTQEAYDALPEKTATKLYIIY